MIRFEKDKLIIEIEAIGDGSVGTYFALLKSLNTVTYYMAEYASGEQRVMDELSGLHYVLGRALCEVDYEQMRQFEQSLGK